MTVKEAIRRSRSYRRFNQARTIPETDLVCIIEAARLSPSGRNAQALKFIVSHTAENNEKIFPTLGWAGYLTDWDGPEEGERPAAYIIQLLDTRIVKSTLGDEGITAQSMLLQAVELGYGGCIIASVKRNALRELLNIPDCMEILNVIALGEPAETVVIEDMKGDDFKYWRDEKGVHHVPKRSIGELISEIL